MPGDGSSVKSFVIRIAVFKMWC